MDFHAVSWVFSFCSICMNWVFAWSPWLGSIWGGTFAIKCSSLWSPSPTRVAADIDLGFARLWERYCHASHAWHQLCESASSCSAICPRPGSLIRKESCGKVCFSLLNAPHSLQLFVRVGAQRKHRGARDHYAEAKVWGAHWHCENRKGEKLKTVHKNIRQAHILWE